MDEQPACILAVDDIESNLVALEAILQGPGVRVVRARSGQDALRALLADEFALILLDVQMPEMDGFEAAAAIRKRKKSGRIPIIFLTAHGADSEKTRRAYAIGAVDFLSKPIEEQALRAKVHAIVDMWRRAEEVRREATADTERRLEEERQRWETDTLRARVAAQEQATAEAQMARREAEEANRIKDEFLAVVSHELRTPLNAILGWATALQRKVATDPAFARGLDAIERNAKAQSKLIDDLLDTSSVMAHTVQLERSLVLLPDILTAVVEEMRAAAERKQIVLEVVLNQQDLPSLNGDPQRLRQIFTHVLSNAIKFTPAGGRVAVRTLRVGSQVGVQVQDTGVGIPPAFLPHVFDRFRQSDGTAQRRHGGLGIGLSVAQHLVFLHGGTIRAESAGVGRGTTFTIVLPVGALAPADGPASGPPLTADDHVSLERVRVLVVDDEPDAREAVRALLESRGAAVLIAETATAAVEAVGAWRPDVLVSDVGMPDQDGLTLLRRIRALPEAAGGRVAAIALTAYGTPQDIADTRAAGFDVHLVKPVDASRLIGAVAALTAANPR